jgi:hypothetical protein
MGVRVYSLRADNIRISRLKIKTARNYPTTHHVLSVLLSRNAYIVEKVLDPSNGCIRGTEGAAGYLLLLPPSHFI